MKEIEFRTRREGVAGGTLVVSVVGELDLYVAPEFEQALALNGDAHGRVVIDLSECTFMDSTALGILVRAHREIAPNNLNIVVSGPGVLRAFEVSGLDSRFVLHPDLESALNDGAVRGSCDNDVLNQVLFREVNEQIEQLAERLGGDGRNQLICECGNPKCIRQIELTPAEYDCVRAHASRFVVALNHENPETESIVEQNERFAVVETFAGTRSRLARATDPRSQHRIRISQRAASAETAWLP